MTQVMTSPPVSRRVGTNTMRAAVIENPKTLRVVEATIPVPGSHQVLVRLEGCGVCASNIPPWEGRDWFKYPLAPGALGHEGWGIVEAVGNDVRSFRGGDRVAMLSQNAYAEFDVADEDQVIS